MSMANFINDNNTSIINPPPEYSLLYDDKTGGLRDKTYHELNKEINDKMIKCPCSNKTYTISSQWVRSHFDTQKHLSWKTLIQEEHIKKYGHCCSSEHIINLLNKELRDLKCNVSHLTDDKKKLLSIVEKYKNEILKASNEVIDLKCKLTKLNDENTKLLKENTLLKCHEVDNEVFMDCNL